MAAYQQFLYLLCLNCYNLVKLVIFVRFVYFSMSVKFYYLDCALNDGRLNVDWLAKSLSTHIIMLLMIGMLTMAMILC